MSNPFGSNMPANGDAEKKKETPAGGFGFGAGGFAMGGAKKSGSTPAAPGGFGGFGASASKKSDTDDDGSASVISLASTTESEKAKDAAAKAAKTSLPAGGFGAPPAATAAKSSGPPPSSMLGTAPVGGFGATGAPKTAAATSGGFGGFGGLGSKAAAPSTLEKSDIDDDSSASVISLASTTESEKAKDAAAKAAKKPATGSGFGAPPAATAAKSSGGGGSGFGGTAPSTGFGVTNTNKAATTTAPAVAAKQATPSLGVSAAPAAKKSGTAMDDDEDEDLDIPQSEGSAESGFALGLSHPQPGVAASSLSTVKMTSSILNLLRDSYDVYRDFNTQQWGSAANNQPPQQGAGGQQQPQQTRSQWSQYGKQALSNVDREQGFPASMALLVWNFSTSVLALGELGLGQSKMASQLYLQWYTEVSSSEEEDEDVFSLLATLDSTNCDFDSLEDLSAVARRVWFNLWIGDFRKSGEMIAKSFKIAKRASPVEAAVENLVQDIIQLLVNPCDPHNVRELEAWRSVALKLFGEAKELLPPRDELGGDNMSPTAGGYKNSMAYNAADDSDEESEEMLALRDLLMDVVQMCTGDPTILGKLVMDNFNMSPQAALAAHCALIEPNATLPMLASSFTLFVAEWNKMNLAKAVSPSDQVGDHWLNLLVSSLLKTQELSDVTTAVDTIVKAALKESDTLLPLEDSGAEKLLALRLTAAHVADLCSPFQIGGSEQIQKAVFARNDLVCDFVSMFASGEGDERTSTFSAWVLGVKYLAMSPLTDPAKVSSIIKSCVSHFVGSGDNGGCAWSRLTQDMASFIETISTYFDPAKPHQKHLRDVLRSRANTQTRVEVLDPYFLVLDQVVSTAAADVLGCIADRYLANAQIAMALSVLQHPLSSRGSSLTTSPSSGADQGAKTGAGAATAGLLSSATAHAATAAGASHDQSQLGDVERVYNIVQDQLFTKSGKDPKRKFMFDCSATTSSDDGAEEGAAHHHHVDPAAAIGVAHSSSALCARHLLESEHQVSDSDLAAYQLPQGALQIGEALRSGLIDSCGEGGSGAVAECGNSLELAGRLYDVAVASGKVAGHQQHSSNAQQQQYFVEKKQLLAALVRALSSVAKMPNTLTLYLATWSVRLVVSSAPTVQGRSLVGGGRTVVQGRYKNQGGNGSVASMAQLLAINAKLQEVPVEASPQREVLSQQILQIYRTPALRPSLEF